MTRDDIICEADAWLKMNGRASDYQTCFVMALFAQHISALVAAQEREACAKLVEDKFDFCGDELTAAEAIRKLKNENSALNDSLYSRDKSLTYAQIQLHAAHWTMTFLSMCLVVMTLAAIAAVIWAVRMSP